MSIGLNPSNTVKAKRMPKAQERARLLRALGCDSLADGNVERQKRAAKAGKIASDGRKKSREAMREGEQPCPKRALLEAARAGDEYAMWQAENVYGKTWRKR